MKSLNAIALEVQLNVENHFAMESFSLQTFHYPNFDKLKKY